MATSIGLTSALHDDGYSWEAGMQNWTDDMIPEFQRLRGYDPIAAPLLVLAGYCGGRARMAATASRGTSGEALADLYAN